METAPASGNSGPTLRHKLARTAFSTYQASTEALAGPDRAQALTVSGFLILSAGLLRAPATSLRSSRPAPRSTQTSPAWAGDLWAPMARHAPNKLHRAGGCPEHALTSSVQAGPFQWMDYAETLQQAADVGAALTTCQGVSKGSRVSIFSINTPQWMISMQASAGLFALAAPVAVLTAALHAGLQ